MPLVFLPLVAIVKPIFISERAPTFAEDVLRSVLLLGTTTIASVIREFGLLAGLIGCLTGFYAQLLPPLIHLRMVAMRERSPCRRMAKVCSSAKTFTYSHCGTARMARVADGTTRVFAQLVRIECVAPSHSYGRMGTCVLTASATTRA